MFVEAYEHARLAFSRILRGSGLNNITIACNGKEALDIIATNEKFDLILMDKVMAVMNGLDATKAIRDIVGYENVPIIICSSHGNLKGDKEECLRSGATAWLAKPISKQDFLEKIGEYIPEILPKIVS